MRRTILILLALLAALLTLAAVQYVRRPDSSLAPLYDTYRHHPGLRTALIYDYPVDDSTTVDMLLLTASDSAAWQWMTREFNIRKPSPAQQRRIDNGNNVCRIYHAEKTNPRERCAFVPGESNLVVVSLNMKTVSIFDIETAQQKSAIIKKQVQDLKVNNLQTKQTIK